MSQVLLIKLSHPFPYLSGPGIHLWFLAQVFTEGPHRGWDSAPITSLVLRGSDPRAWTHSVLVDWNRQHGDIDGNSENVTSSWLGCRMNKLLESQSITALSNAHITSPFFEASGKAHLLPLSSWNSPSLNKQTKTNHFFFLFCIYLIFGHEACWSLVPQPGIQTAHPPLEAGSLNHWTTKENQILLLFDAYALLLNLTCSARFCLLLRASSQESLCPSSNLTPDTVPSLIRCAVVPDPSVDWKPLPTFSLASVKL